MGLYDQYLQEANQYINQYGLLGAHNGPADAFRHAYVSAAMAQDYGTLVANIAGQANEIRGNWHGQPAGEQNMDLHNNEIGRGLASGTTTRSQIATATLSALNNGQLITNINSSSVYDPISEITAAEAAISEYLANAIQGFGEGGFVLSEYVTAEQFLAVTTAMTDLSASISEYIASEAGQNLSPNVRNQLQERADYLETQAESLETMLYDPLVLDLNGDGVQTISSDDNAATFDLFTGEGISASHGWVSSEDAFLSLDKNSNGVIDNITELFGSSSVSGFEALSGYDENGDSVIDQNDAIFSELLVWQDVNGDGISQEDELSHLSDVGIISINLVTNEEGELQNGNLITRSSTVTFSNGSTNQISDVNLGTNVDSIQSNQEADTFVFNEILGSHNLGYFEDGLDTISLVGLSYNDLNIMNTGYGARIEIGEDFALNIQGVSAEELSPEDFLFV